MHQIWAKALKPALPLVGDVGESSHNGRSCLLANMITVEVISQIRRDALMCNPSKLRPRSATSLTTKADYRYTKGVQGEPCQQSETLLKSASKIHHGPGHHCEAIPAAALWQTRSSANPAQGEVSARRFISFIPRMVI